jgi:hypothetical protein
MLTTFDLKTWIEGLVAYAYFVNDFPAKSPDAAAIVRLSASPAPSEWSNVIYPAFQLIVRGPADDGQDTAELKSFEILQALHNCVEFSIAGNRVVHCIAEHSVPFYLGLDEIRRPLYSLNFELTMQM